MNRLSKSEHKYRTKFIQENHYNKSEQKQFDTVVKKMHITYKNIYFNVRNNVRNGRKYMFYDEYEFSGSTIASYI